MILSSLFNLPGAAFRKTVDYAASWIPAKPQKTWSTQRAIIGGIALLALAGLVFWFAQDNQTNLEKKIDPLPEDRFIPQCSEKVFVFTSYDTNNPNRLSLSRKVAENQRVYCEAEKYCYEAVEKNLAPDSLPYWSKIAGIIQHLNKKDKPEWIVWMDDDAVVTNSNIKLYEFIQTHGGENPDMHILVTEDSIPGTDMNTGILMVRNSAKSLEFFKALWPKRHDFTQDLRYKYGTCPNQYCLHEQQAMHDLIRQRPDLAELVKIIPQRGQDGIGINTLERFNHYDIVRGMYLNYNSDPLSTRHRRGDFISQCSGVALQGIRGNDYEVVVRNLREECIDKLIPGIYDRALNFLRLF